VLDPDKARSLVTGVAGRLSSLAGRGGQGGGAAPRTVQQTVTIARPAAEVAAAWRDPETLTRLLGDAGQVQSSGPGSYRWTLSTGSTGDGAEPVTWESVLHEEGASLRFASAGEPAGDAQAHEVTVLLTEAPQGRGTEVTLRLHLPVPALAAGGLAFTVLYRCRALLQTGEVPTLHPVPAAR